MPLGCRTLCMDVSNDCSQKKKNQKSICSINWRAMEEGGETIAQLQAICRLCHRHANIGGIDWEIRIS